MVGSTGAPCHLPGDRGLRLAGSYNLTDKVTSDHRTLTKSTTQRHDKCVNYVETSILYSPWKVGIGLSLPVGLSFSGTVRQGSPGLIFIHVAGITEARKSVTTNCKWHSKGRSNTVESWD